MADFLWVLEKEKHCTTNMDSGKTFNIYINYIELKTYMDNLVQTQNIYTKITE